MNKIEELENKLTEIQKELEELKEKEQKDWVPENYEHYWFVNDRGNPESNTWINDPYDRFRLNQHNVFKNREQAEHHANCLKTKIKLRQLAQELNGNQKIDFNNDQQEKYYIILNKGNLCCHSTYLSNFIGNIYCLKDRFLENAKLHIGEQNLIDMIKEGV